MKIPEKGNCKQCSSSILTRDLPKGAHYKKDLEAEGGSLRASPLITRRITPFSRSVLQHTHIQTGPVVALTFSIPYIFYKWLRNQ